VPLSRDLFVGFDGGGSKTICIIGDSKGNIIASATGASTNLKSRPPEKVKEIIQELLIAILKFVHSQQDRIKGVFVSTAGGDREEDQLRWRKWILEFGLNPDQLIVTNDAVAALTAGTKEKNGIVLIAGTGSILYYVNEKYRKPVRIGGWGYLIGDEGSGYDIGNQALRKIIRSYDGRDQNRDVLTCYILKKLGLETPEQLITFIYEDPYPRKLIASVAKYVINLAEQDEPNAQLIIFQAVDQLTQFVVTAINDHEESKTYPLVVSGGLFHSTYFKGVFDRILREKGCKQPIILPKYPPVVGSYMSALLQSGEIITSEIEQNINKSWERAINLFNNNGGNIYE
jgi:N-acetylglucosamine kinase-like BadF-type ATPase